MKAKRRFVRVARIKALMRSIEDRVVKSGTMSKPLETRYRALERALRR